LHVAILKIRLIHLVVRVLLPLACMLWLCGKLHAQLPFYTDDTTVTEPGKWHFEFFNEYDALQLQYPNLKQNTANFKLNYGLPHNLEVNVDFPYRAIYRTRGTSLPPVWETPIWASRQTFTKNPLPREFRHSLPAFTLNSQPEMQASSLARD
jgi:hypothetical protein